MQDAELEAPAMTPFDAFGVLDMRVGRIVKAEPNVKAVKPAYKLWIDFGALGVKTSSAQLAALYRSEDLEGRLIVAAVNLGDRRIAGFKSEVLVLGAPDDEGRVVLLALDRDVPIGGRIF
ncbi:molecular chaperone [Capsulimonas corticalis]|uniref:Molecular chaperone n=2 Tax=Capsulimonas corticalis TaxID=2219043 RepID=A0A9N7Q9I8_9BACT|nr:molecular chaperone [Capsulimonas corticalis]